MSEIEANISTHSTTGGKTLASVQRPRYKSWRKKYRKMRYQFDRVLEENKRTFRHEQRLEGIARRLREDLDGLLDLLLDLNQSPALPPELRFDVSLEPPHSSVALIPSVVRDDITPEEANSLFQEYTSAVQRGQIPHLDLHVIRDQIDRKLACQGVVSLEKLESRVSHTVPVDTGEFPEDIRCPKPAGFLTCEEEDAYLLRLDAKLGDRLSFEKEKEKEIASEEKHWADLTTREAERQAELLNPQSQHNWLKALGGKQGPGEMDDNESLTSHDAKPVASRGGKGKRDLAKQVGDRAVGRAREGFSPGAASIAYGDDDELAFVDDHPGSGKKRGKDPDGTYRVKGGKTAGKGKRKRSGEDVGSTKKAKTVTDEG